MNIDYKFIRQLNSYHQFLIALPEILVQKAIANLNKKEKKNEREKQNKNKQTSKTRPFIG